MNKIIKHSLNIKEDRLLEKELFFLLTDYIEPDRGRILELLNFNLDWGFILGHLSFNRMIGVAYVVLNQIKPDKIDEINSEFRMPLKMGFVGQSVRQKSYKAEVLSISETLNKSKIRHAFLKGAVLSNILYPEGTRISNDIDLLIERENLGKCANVLRGLGFVQGRYEIKTNSVVEASRRDIINHQMNFGELMPFVKKTEMIGLDYIEIDVNFSLDWMPNDKENRVSEFLVDSAIYSMEGGEIISLDKELFLIHLCMHYYKEACVCDWVYKLKDMNYYKILDIYSIVKSKIFEIDWDRFVDKVKKYKLERECYYTLWYTKELVPRLYHDDYFQSILEKIKPMDCTYLN